MRDDIELIKKIILKKVAEATTPQVDRPFNGVVEHERNNRGQYVYYRVDYPALFGFWFDPEDSSRLKMMRFTDGSIVNADEIYLHDLTHDATYRYVHKALLLKKLAGEERGKTKETIQ